MKSHLRRILQENSVMEGTSGSGSKRKAVQPAVLEVTDSDSSDSSTTSNYTLKRCKIVSSFFLFYNFFGHYFLVNFYDISGGTRISKKNTVFWVFDVSYFFFYSNQGFLLLIL